MGKNLQSSGEDVGELSENESNTDENVEDGEDAQADAFGRSAGIVAIVVNTRI